MDKTSTWIPIITLVFLLLIISSASATTDASDVSALQDLYRTLSFPPQLTGWKTKGGDPCGELWKGVSCDGSSILYIKLNGLDLGGYLGEQLNLMNLKQLDLSSNHIQGAIPSLLPPNATNIDLSCNDLNMSIPYTLTSMKHLRHLNFSHNALSGPIGNVFTGLHNLKQMDLSFNNFTGDLPSSFGNLTNLTGLYLQNNKFTGSVIFLANLPLIELNIQNNHFSGVVPKQFQYVPNLWIGGNAFQIGGDYPPWNFPEDTIPSDQNINSPPATESNAIENHPSLGAGEHQQKRFSPAVIACAVGGVALVATCAAFIIAIHIKRSRVNSLQDLEDDDNSLPVTQMPPAFCRLFREVPLSTTFRLCELSGLFFSARCLLAKTISGTTARLYCIDTNREVYVTHDTWRNCKLMASNIQGWILLLKVDFSDFFLFNLRDETRVLLPNLPTEENMDLIGEWKAYFKDAVPDSIILVMGWAQNRLTGDRYLILVYKRLSDNVWTVKRLVSNAVGILDGPIIFNGHWVFWVRDGDCLTCLNMLDEDINAHLMIRFVPYLLHGLPVSLIVVNNGVMIYQDRSVIQEPPMLVKVDLHNLDFVGLQEVNLEIKDSSYPYDIYCIDGRQGWAVGPIERTNGVSEIYLARRGLNHLLKVQRSANFTSYLEYFRCDDCAHFFSYILGQ
ncbi:hypothetical protein AQUCO_00900116v1 [Aquilegia coerulea]|uniref:Leucine-rich repeat-containing N-terminal plant-type domain-containing protein n=1 Tax=Aquilegia coerulea TaxID=218851 RepID=A0A2G5EC56_AQUCA|nr:hypothetical protein AQUCO_00900116v1 [Aquilegia coerulea]